MQLKLERWELQQYSYFKNLIFAKIRVFSIPRFGHIVTQLTRKRATPRSEPHKNIPTIFYFIANHTKFEKPQHITRCQINPYPLIKLGLLYKILYKIFLLVLSRRFAGPLAPTKYLDLRSNIILLAISYNIKLTQVSYILYKNSKLLN